MRGNQEVAEDLLGKFGNQVFDFDEPYGLLTFSTTREEILSILEFLKDHPTYKVNFLTDLTGVQFPDKKEKEFMVVYHLHSFIQQSHQLHRFEIDDFLGIVAV